MRVVYADRALGQLEAIRDWLAAEAGPDIARRIVRELLDRCDSLSDFPRRGTPHDAIRPGLRTLSHRRAFTIGYRVDGEIVTVLGFIGRGQRRDALVGEG